MNNKNYGKRLSAIITKIDDVTVKGMTDHEKNIAFFNNEIGSLKAEIKKQTDARNKAVSENDTTGFREAARRIAAAEVELKQFQDSLAQIKKKPTMSKAQAEELLLDLQGLQDDINADANKEAVELVRQLLKLDDETSKIQDDLIMIARTLYDHAQGAITDRSSILESGKARVNTIIGATPNYPWKLAADIIRRRSNQIGVKY